MEVSVGEGISGFIRRSDLSRDRAEQRPERFAVGEKVDALVTAFDKNSRRVSLSIKAREVAEEKEAVAQYGSSDSGATLGDILGSALGSRDAEEAPAEEAAPEEAPAEEAPAAEAEAPAEDADEEKKED